MLLPVCEVHWALHFILTFFTFRAEARPIFLARQIDWWRSLRDVIRHLKRPLVQRTTLKSIMQFYYLSGIPKFERANESNFSGHKEWFFGGPGRI